MMGCKTGAEKKERKLKKENQDRDTTNNGRPRGRAWTGTS